MKKALILFMAIVSLAACTTHKQSTISEMALWHRNYVLISFDGQPIVPENMTPRIEFGQNLFVSGVMCNDFNGKGKLTGNVLTVENMAMTQKLCIDDVRNQLDRVIGQMLTQGAVLTVQDKTMTLKTNEHQLVFVNKDWVS